jgi:uncharacterized protein
MIKIGCLSDTHGFLNERLLEFFAGVDEVWHAGDIGSSVVLESLERIKPVCAVYGNIDGADVRKIVPAHQKFVVEDMRVWITHIGGYPGNYDRSIKAAILADPPDIFICGHSHILRVMYDKKLNLLYINPGACGKSGFHKVMTAVRFKIHNREIFDMEVWEMQRR